jgi:Glycosyltransferase Family 4
MKVMVLAYDFPPLISIGGQRPFSWYKYLPDKETNVTVVARRWSSEISSPLDYVRETPGSALIENDNSGSKIIRVAFKPNLRDKLLLRFGVERLATLRKLLSYFYAFAEHLFYSFDSKSSIFFAAAKEIENNRPDVIIATGEPFILFKYASALSHKYHIPWIADYRDNWTGNQGNYNLGFLQQQLNRFYRSREKKYIANTKLITTAAPTYAASLKSLHPGKEVEVIYNGYDEAYFDSLETIRPPLNKFVITYGGTLYPHQNLEMFLDGLLEFITQNKLNKNELVADFYGIDLQAGAHNRLFNYKKELDGYITAQPRIPYPELIKKMRASHLLLLLSRKGAGWLNAKIFDYLAVKRKIFLVENDHGILESILKETNGGISLNSKEDIALFLKAEYDNFKNGVLKDSGVNDQALKYSRKNQAKILSALLYKKFQSK